MVKYCDPDETELDTILAVLGSSNTFRTELAQAVSWISLKTSAWI